MSTYSIAIHGGAGTIIAADMTPALKEAYENALREALHAGYALLEKKASAMEAVIEATKLLEDNILFNAGRGSVFTRKGTHEMDASLMEGKNLNAGAVAGVQNIRNPIELAAAVMKSSQHVFLSGDGAKEFALEKGIVLEPEGYFFSQFRYDQWKGARDAENYSLDHSRIAVEQMMKEKKFGTVGAVACDMEGNLAAATSTGGMTNKNYGRIGDTPIIGIGTYADNATCAISCTGHGELFIKSVAAYDVSARMQYGKLSLEQAMHETVMVKLRQIGGEGGMIGVDASGRISMIFNSEGMYRAMKDGEGREEISIFRKN